MKHASNFSSKQVICKRMLKHAANQLGLASVELLDPNLVLLLEAEADEIYRLSAEVRNIETRIVEKLAGILSSKVAVAPQPAHAILHASSIEPSMPLDKQTGFSHVPRTHKRSEKKQTYTFYPVCETCLYNGDVRYLISNGLFYELDTDQTKTLLARPRNRDWSETPPATFWIGLELDETISSLKDLSFYFDFPSLEQKSEYLNLLPYTSWSLGDQAINLRQGIQIQPAAQTTRNNEQQLFARFEIPTILDKRILEYYSKHYLTVTTDIDLSNARSIFPEKLQADYLPEFIKEFQQPLLWIEVRCENALQAAVVDELAVSINAFPVANKILRSRVEHLSQMSQVVTLSTENNEYLIALQSVSDVNGCVYSELPFNDTPSTHYKTYSLRRGGFERFGTWDGRDLISKGFDLLIHESSRGKSNSSSEIEQEDQKEQAERVQEIVNQMSRSTVALNAYEKREVPTYLMLDKYEGELTLFVHYWLTACDAANAIKSGSNLQSLEVGSMPQGSIQLLTTTIGGTPPPRAEQRSKMFQEVLKTRSMLVSERDIINFCKREFKDTIQEVEIKEGIALSDNPREHLKRTLDVYLRPHAHLQNLFTGAHSGDIFKEKLQQNSPQVYNYRILIHPVENE